MSRKNIIKSKKMLIKLALGFIYTNAGAIVECESQEKLATSDKLGQAVNKEVVQLSSGDQVELFYNPRGLHGHGKRGNSHIWFGHDQSSDGHSHALMEYVQVLFMPDHYPATEVEVTADDKSDSSQGSTSANSSFNGSSNSSPVQTPRKVEDDALNFANLAAAASSSILASAADELADDTTQPDASAISAKIPAKVSQTSLALIPYTYASAAYVFDADAYKRQQEALMAAQKASQTSRLNDVRPGDDKKDTQKTDDAARKKELEAAQREKDADIAKKKALEAEQRKKDADAQREQELQAARERNEAMEAKICLLYTSPSPRDGLLSRMPSSA